MSPYQLCGFRASPAMRRRLLIFELSQLPERIGERLGTVEIVTERSGRIEH